MPTLLPPSRPRVEKKRRLFGALLNTFMVVSALALTFVVLVQEQRYANGQPGPFADTLSAMTQSSPAEISSEDQAVLPPD